MALLQVENLKYSAGNTEILRGMNLKVEEGSIHAVVGPNGAGKSTLSYTVMGLNSPEHLDGGSIVFDGAPLNGLAPEERARRGISMALQDPARFEGISVRDFLSAGAADASEDALRAAISSVALDPDKYMHRYVDDGLSGGERKRIEVASLVAMQPKLMILDEPDSGIDVEALNAIFDLLAEIHDNGKTVMLVTHSEQVLSKADRATLMCCGKNVAEGDGKEISLYFEEKCIPCETHDPDLAEENNVS